jgi:hypothetical protein
MVREGRRNSDEWMMNGKRWLSWAGTSLFALLRGREVEVRGAGELRRVVPSWSEVDGSAPADSPS